MENRNSDKKIIQFVEYPNANVKLLEIETKIIEVSKRLGQVSVNDILSEIQPDWNKYQEKTDKEPKKYSISERFEVVKHVARVTNNCMKITVATKRLRQLGCIKVNERGYE